MKNLLFMHLVSASTLALKKSFRFSEIHHSMDISPLQFSDTGSGLMRHDRATAEKTIRAARPALRSDRSVPDEKMLQNCPDIICAVDRHGRFVSINDACLHIWGYEAGEIEGRHFTEFLLPADKEKTMVAATNLLKGGGKSVFENSYIHKDGRAIPMLWSVRWSEQDQLIYSIGRDASDIKSAEAALQEGEQRYRSLFDHNPDAVFAFDMEGRFTGINEKAAEIIGSTPADLAGRHFMPFVAPEHMDLTMQNFAKAARGEKVSYEIALIKQNNEKKYINIVSLPMIINGKMTGMYAIVKDTTDSHITEEERQRQHEALEHKIKERTCQLEQSNKELKAFSYSVSHDLRAPLRIINGYAKLLNNEYSQKFDNDGREFMGAIIENTRYMGRLIDDLLNLSRLGREAVNNAQVDMAAIIGVAIHEMKMKEEVITADIKIHNLHTSICDQHLIKQVWINLISNAIKYSRKKSKPEIEIGSYEKDDSTVYYIKDNGAGFDMKFAAKLFGVFVRLHDRSEFDGTGVGLALVHRIITKHNGKVWANGKVDEGAVFYFSLPNK